MQMALAQTVSKINLHTNLKSQSLRVAELYSGSKNLKVGYRDSHLFGFSTISRLNGG